MPTYLDAQVAFIAGLVAETLKASGVRAAKSTIYDTGKTITVTPLIDGAAFAILVGAAHSVTCTERLAKITVIPGTTTYAQVAADWAACGQAVALGTIAGTAGTFPAGYVSMTDSIALYNDPVPPICRGVYLAPMPSNPPDGMFPCLCVYRKGERIEGSAPRQKRTAEIAIGYYVGKKTGPELQNGWGSLSTRVTQINGALVKRWAPGYLIGVRMETFCTLDEIASESVVYGSALPDGTVDAEFPSVTLTVRVIHSDQVVADSGTLDTVVCKYGLNQAPTTGNEFERRYADMTP